MRYEPGEAHPNAKLTEQDVREIRKFYEKIGITQERLAEIYDVSQAQVSRIINGILWGSVKDERKKGEWIGNDFGYCSVCGAEGLASDIWNGCDDGMFCPNCGADLRSVEDV